jgi:hypothetical protein
VYLRLNITPQRHETYIRHRDKARATSNFGTGNKNNLVVSNADEALLSRDQWKSGILSVVLNLEIRRKHSNARGRYKILIVQFHHLLFVKGALPDAKHELMNSRFKLSLLGGTVHSAYEWSVCPEQKKTAYEI